MGNLSDCDTEFKNKSSQLETWVAQMLDLPNRLMKLS